MKVFYISLLCCAIANATEAEHFTNSWTRVVAGQSFELKWDGNTGAVNITLNQGSVENYTTVNIIATNITTNSFYWTPDPPAEPDDKFFLALTDSTGAMAVGAEFVILMTNSSSVPPTSNSSIPFNPTNTNSSINDTMIDSKSNALNLAEGLSVGAIAGIAIGGAAAVICIVVAITATWALNSKKIKTQGGGQQIPHVNRGGAST